jgi:hypothetical protein
MAYKTNYIDLNKPAKVISLQYTSINGLTQWPHNDGDGDKWWSGGSNPKYYQWTVVATVTAQNHGSHQTRKDFQYNGLDIQVGDWVAGATTGTCNRIISISAKTTTTITMVVEDWLRYNTYRSSIGSGIFSTGMGVCFQLNENGHPMLDPVPSSITSATFYQNINSRFQYLNPQMHYVLDQTAHGFGEGDVVSITGSGFAKTTTGTASKTVGTVTHPGPGPNQFMMRPNTRVIDFMPAIPGTIGDFIYTDNSTAGGLSISDLSGRVQFIKIANAIASSVTGTVADPTTTHNNIIEINEQQITFTGTVSLAEVVSQVNAAAIDGIVASAPGTPTSVTTSLGLAYGLVGQYPTAQASINGTTVSFTTTTAGQAAYGIPVGIALDMAADINAAGISNLVATKTGTNDLTLTETTGQAITITNVANDGNGNPFAGASSCSGLVLSTPASTSSYLKLTRTDGGEILVDDILGSSTIDCGIFSVHNGRLPLAVTVEQGLRTAGGTTVVANLLALNFLSAQTGDSAYVLDTGNTEFAFYIYNGSSWVLVADEDSAATDANTLSAVISQAGGSGTFSVGTVSNTSRITLISVEVTQAFDDAPTLTVGDASDNDRLVTNDELDLGTVGTYAIQPTYQYTTGSDATINAYFSVASATTGSAKILVSYM